MSLLAVLPILPLVRGFRRDANYPVRDQRNRLSENGHVRSSENDHDLAVADTLPDAHDRLGLGTLKIACMLTVLRFSLDVLTAPR